MGRGTRMGCGRDALVAVGVAMALGLSAGRATADVAKGEVAGAIDLNTASIADLAALPGLGESKARAIVAWRDATPFRSVDELRDVKGIGDKMLEKLRPHLVVSQRAASSGASRPGTADTTAQAASGSASSARAAAQAAQAGKGEASGR